MAGWARNMESAALVSATAPNSKSATARADPGALESYRRREPEHSLLYQLVAAEADTVRRAVAQASLHGRGLPATSIANWVPAARTPFFRA